MILVAVFYSSLPDNGKFAVILKLITAIWMILEVLEITELISDEVVADNLFSHVIIAHVSIVQIAAASKTGPKNEIDWSRSQEDKMMSKVEDKVDVKVGRASWNQSNLKFF